MSLRNKIFFSLLKPKKTAFPASSFRFSGARVDAKLKSVMRKLLRTKLDFSPNVSLHRRKLHGIRVPKDNPMKKQKGKEISVVIEEFSFFEAATELLPGDSSKSRRSCRICMVQKRASRMFNETRCDHSFCFDCIRRHIATKLKEENTIKVQCPEPKCKSLITPRQCKSILPLEVIYRWEEALHYCRTPPVLVFECPFDDCSAELVDDGKDIEVMRYECPQCRTKICGKCREFEHEGMGCVQFKELVERLVEEQEFEFALVKLAEKENWKKCPNCSNYAAKTDGSNRVECWCKYKHCYHCRSKWSIEHSCFN